MTSYLRAISAPIPHDPVEAIFAMDIWDVRHMPGVRYTAHQSNHLLNFTVISSPFRSLVKRYIRFMLTQRSHKDCARRIRYLQIFFDFFTSRFPLITTLQSLSRNDVEAYLSFLSSTKGSLNRYGKRIGEEHAWRGICILRQFLEYLERSASSEAPCISVRRLIWPQDGGRLPQSSAYSGTVKYLPESVIYQLEQHMQQLSPGYLPIVMLLRASGWRISDVLNLRYGTCLEYTASGWWLCGDIPKTDVLNHKVPISDEIAALVSTHIALVKDKFSEERNPERYLFPAQDQRRRGRPMTSESVQDALNRLAKVYEIKDAKGNVFHFETHAFRHTKGVELINNGMSLIHVQKWLAHLTPEMTLVYAKILDSTMRKEWEQAFAKGAVRIDVQGKPEVVNTEQLGSEEGIEWEHIRHNLDAVRLADGYCFKPKKANCPTQDTPCYTCRHFCTTPDFLAQFEKQERDLRELIELGEKAGSEIWVDRNTQKLNRVLPVIQVLQSGNLHHPAGKAVREYTLEERAKRG